MDISWVVSRARCRILHWSPYRDRGISARNKEGEAMNQPDNTMELLTDIAAEAGAIPKAAGVPGGVVVVRELPVADKASDLIFQAPRAHIQGELLQFQDEEEGETIEPLGSPAEGLPESQEPSELEVETLQPFEEF